MISQPCVPGQCHRCPAGLRLLTKTLFLLGAATGGLAWYGSAQITRRRPPDKYDSPANWGLDYEDVLFTSADGVALRGWFIPAQPARGTVVLCHGHAGSMDPDLKYAPWLHDAGYNVLMFDFRGHGRSGGTVVSMGYLERYDLLGALHFLHARGIDRVGVLGFSMGGAVAMATAPLNRAIRVVISDGGFATLQGAVAGGIRERFKTRWSHELLSYLMVSIAGWRLGVNLRAADPVRWVAHISPAALLLIHGGRDPYVSLTDVSRLYTKARPPKDVWIVPEAGHRRVDEHRPEEYRQRVLDVLDRHLARSTEGS